LPLPEAGQAHAELLAELGRLRELRKHGTKERCTFPEPEDVYVAGRECATWVAAGRAAVAVGKSWLFAPALACSVEGCGWRLRRAKSGAKAAGNCVGCQARHVAELRARLAAKDPALCNRTRGCQEPAAEHGLCARHLADKRRRARKDNVRRRARRGAAGMCGSHPDRPAVAGGVCEGCLDAKLRREYGLSLATKLAMVEHQGGACPACGDAYANLGAANVDHDGDQGPHAVRSLLCRPCNLALGLAGEAPATLRAAVAYLATWRDSIGEAVAWRKDARWLTKVRTQLLAKHGHACRICRQAFKGTAHVDHDHASGLVRGLLCKGCNTLLGKVRERPDVLVYLAAYLERHLSDPPCDMELWGVEEDEAA
jgi:hypothetical protein